MESFMVKKKLFTKLPIRLTKEKKKLIQDKRSYHQFLSIYNKSSSYRLKIFSILITKMDCIMTGYLLVMMNTRTKIIWILK